MANLAHKAFIPPLLEDIFTARAEGLTGMPILDRDPSDPTASSLPTPRLPSWAWGYQGSSRLAVGLLGFVDNPPYAASGSSIPDISNITASSPTSSGAIVPRHVDVSMSFNFPPLL